MEKQIVIESPDGRFGAIFHGPQPYPPPWWSFSRNCLELTPTFELLATSWQPRDTSRSRQTSSGGRSLTLILT